MDFLLSLVDFNEAVDYTFVLYCAVIYTLLFWLVVCAWVGKDAFKRYSESTTAAVFWFLIGFIFGLPAIILYLLIRPEDIYQSGSYFGGGVNVPIANFVGADGEFLMGIQLKVNSSELTEQVRDMRLSIDWESIDPNKPITSGAVVAEASEVSQKLNRLQRLINKFKRSSSQSKQQAAEQARKQAEETKAIEKAIQTAVLEADRLESISGEVANRDQQTPNFPHSSKKKHKKKKHRF